MKIKEIIHQLLKDKDGNFSLREVITIIYVLMSIVSWIAQQFFGSDVHRINGVNDRGLPSSENAHQPEGFPLFCTSSHALSGAKYSIMAPPSICRSPVIA